MPHHRDPFIDAAEEYRSALIGREERGISWREVLRRAGYDETKRSGMAYHFNRSRHTGAKPHHVPPELIDRLATVLGHKKELTRAAEAAAGFTVVEDDPSTEITVMVQRFYSSEEPSEEQRAEVTTRLLQILSEESTRKRPPARH